MKRYLYLLCLLTGSVIAINPILAQDKNMSDSTGLPGDNFSLQGALAMFEKASSPEDFEKMINTEGNNVNNLDLNGDGDIDYIQVMDNMDKDVHAFVLQVAVSETESQDIAVIELEKTGNETAMLQIIGDEDIYGEPIIVEPDSGNDQAYTEQNSFMAASGPNVSFSNETPAVVFNVWLWPAVRFVYAPGYIVYRSAWGWRHSPHWWRPWRPLRWHTFHVAGSGYHHPFVVVHTRRVVRGRVIYAPVRRHSAIVRTRYTAPINNYRVTRTKTTVTGPRGNSATKKTTTVRGKNGRVKATKTNTKRRNQ